ncbi:MAG: PP2C family protein-serine/threonine phosphatase [Puniceicoccaceae bacterium]
MSPAGDRAGERADWVRWGGCTHPGRFRKSNEDAFLALAVSATEVTRLGKTGRASLADKDFVFAVSDGMGGAKAGEFASRIAVDRITRLFPGSFLSSARGFGRNFEDLVPELFDQIHSEITWLGITYEECRGMGATLSLCWVTPGWVYFGHVGDSRIYYLPANGDLRQISHDHTHAGWLRRMGRLTEREERMHPAGHQLQQVLGGGVRKIDPQIGAIGYEPGDRFLVCSDGLIEGHWDRGIAEYLRTADFDDPRLADFFVETAVRVSGKDNSTAVLFEPWNRGGCGP